jgi:hypothetical protein
MQNKKNFFILFLIPFILISCKYDYLDKGDSVWMPENGQTHKTGSLDSGISISWIKTWESSDSGGSMLETTPQNLAPGKYNFLVQIWHDENENTELGTVLIKSEDSLLKQKKIYASDFKNKHFGGYQRVTTEFEFENKGENISFELVSAESAKIWTGGVSLTQINKKRPFYNIAHRCSTQEKTDEMISLGANAVECDITPVKNNEDVLFKVYHSGDLSYTNEDEFDDYLANLKYHLDEKNISMVMFDCKQDDEISPEKYVQSLAEKLINHSFSPQNVVFSVPAAVSSEFRNLLGTSEDEAPLFPCAMDSYLEDYGDLTPQQWAEESQSTGADFLGVGMSAYAPSPMANWMEWIQALVNKRDTQGEIKKAYYWTLNKKESMRKAIDYGVDGIITNYPSRLDEVMKEDPYTEIIKNADQNDSIFKVHGFFDINPGD